MTRPAWWPVTYNLLETKRGRQIISPNGDTLAQFSYEVPLDAVYTFMKGVFKHIMWADMKRRLQRGDIALPTTQQLKDTLHEGT